jgi:hypothetical protein
MTLQRNFRTKKILCIEKVIWTSLMKPSKTHVATNIHLRRNIVLDFVPRSYGSRKSFLHGTAGAFKHDAALEPIDVVTFLYQICDIPKLWSKYVSEVFFLLDTIIISTNNSI